MKSSILSRRDFCKTTLTAFAAGIAPGALQAAGKAEDIRWNVLVMMTDMHNVHFIGCDHQCTENIRTPNLDRIGMEGMIFRKAYDAYPVCAPTRASLLTGCYPFRHGQFHNSDLLTEAGPQGKTPSLAHVFRDNGYNTAMLGKQHSNLEPLESLPNGTFMGKNIFHGWDFRRWTGGSYEGRVEENRSKGFEPTDEEYDLGLARDKRNEEELQSLVEEYRDRYPEKTTGAPMPDWEKEMVKENRKYTCSGKGLEHAADMSDGTIGFETLDYLDTYAGKREDERFGIDPQKPFFLFLSMQKPHYPWVAPLMQDGTEFWYMYSARPEEDTLTYLHNGKAEPRLIPNPVKEELLLEDPSSPYYGTRDPYAPEAERFARAKYSACITWLDHMFGKVLDRLAILDDPRNPGKKLQDTTIVCFTTDHGDMMGEKRRISKMVKYEGSARVPFLIRMPGAIAPGQYSDILLNHVDMFPTLAGLAGLGDKVSRTIDGKDYSKAVLANDPNLGPERTFSVSYLKEGEYPGDLMSRTQRYKFIRWKDKTRASDTLPVMMLFDMEKDPYETVNLAYEPECRDVVVNESRACDEFMASFYPLEPVALTAAMLEGKQKEPPVKTQGGKGKDDDEG
ncbi:MAG: sulfatase-like hydrolase/transferase [Candidatus Sumerlaeota bacterium]|nr:sulfatase-like hydrolase/transferase [Candidatus Sumerlaeota bacterium]